MFCTAIVLSHSVKLIVPVYEMTYFNALHLNECMYHSTGEKKNKNKIEKFVRREKK